MMKSFFAGLGVAVCLLATGPASANIVVGTTVSGNCFPVLCNITPITRYQQVYASTAFAGPLNIASLGIFDANISGTSTVLDGHYAISLSYAANGVNALSLNGDDNIQGPQTLFWSGWANGEKTDQGLTLFGTRHFYYDPSLGDLLIDIRITDQAAMGNSGLTGYLKTDSTGRVMSRLFCRQGECVKDVSGLVTEFGEAAATDVPEPASIALLGAGLLAFARRRKA